MIDLNTLKKCIAESDNIIQEAKKYGYENLRFLMVCAEGIGKNGIILS
jgi:hypothetical protein